MSDSRKAWRILYWTIVALFTFGPALFTSCVAVYAFCNWASFLPGGLQRNILDAILIAGGMCSAITFFVGGAQIVEEIGGRAGILKQHGLNHP